MVFKTDCTTNARSTLISREPRFDGHVRRNSLPGNNKTPALLPSFAPFFRLATNTGDKAIKLWSRAKRETARDVSVDCLSLFHPFSLPPSPLSFSFSLRPSLYLLHPFARLPRVPHATFYTQHTGVRLYCRVISGSKPTRRITRLSRFCY